MNLDSIFYPKSIAVIGASRQPKAVGNDIVKHLTHQGFEGVIYPINHNATALYGHKVYPSTTAIEDTIDLVIVCIPAPYVEEAIAQAAIHNHTKAAIVISAGCKEIGELELERQVKAVCDTHQVAMIGPNCLGLVNPEIKMNASFAKLMPEFGSIGFISQSGALCTSILDYAHHLKIGFSKFLSIGNKAQIDEIALLEYFASDDKTKVIGMYVEELQDARRFINACQTITKGSNPKPIIVLKSGRTQAGASAVASHTGSLASNDAAYDALFRQAGVLRAYTIRELLEYLDIFSLNRLTSVEQVAVITNAGGPGVLTTDELIINDLKLATLSKETKASLQSFLPKAASTKNPIDILGDATDDRYRQTLELIAKDSEVDAVLTLLTPQSMTEVEATAEAIIDFKSKSDKPIVASFMGQESVEAGVIKMAHAQVATTAFPELAARGLAQMGRFYRWTNQKPSSILTYPDLDKAVVTKAFGSGQTQFPESQALSILKAYGVPTLQSKVATSAAEALAIASEFGGELAMKIVSKDILHKSDVGGVKLHVTSRTVLEDFESMMRQVAKHAPNAELEGVLLMEMAPQGIETIVGVMRDPSLGHMVMCGLGGIYVEILKDVQFAFAPLTKVDAERLVWSLKASALFAGVRGQAAADTDGLIAVLGRISQLVTDFPQIEELDINPLLVLPKGQGVRCLDARIILQSSNTTNHSTQTKSH